MPELNRDRLLRHDASIIVAESRLAFASWGDRLLLALILLAGCAAARSAIASVPDERILLASALSGALSGIVVQLALDRRLQFFRTESPLADDALRRGPALRYLILPHLAVLAGATFTLCLVRPAGAPAFIAAYAIAVPAAHAAYAACSAAARHLAGAGLVVPGLDWGRHWWIVTATGALAGTAAAFLVQLYNAPLAAAASLGLIAMILLMILGRIDYEVVRFEAFAGLSAWQSIRRRGRKAALFLLLQIPLAALVNPQAAVVCLLLGAAALAFIAARTCLYRAYSKRAADLVLTGIAAALAFAASALPLLAPPLALGLAALMKRRADAAAWRLG